MCYTDGKCVLQTFEKHMFERKIKHPDVFYVFLNKHFCALSVLLDIKMCFLMCLETLKCALRHASQNFTVYCMGQVAKTYGTL